MKDQNLESYLQKEAHRHGEYVSRVQNTKKTLVRKMAPHARKQYRTIRDNLSSLKRRKIQNRLKAMADVKNSIDKLCIALSVINPNLYYKIWESHFIALLAWSKIEEDKSPVVTGPWIMETINKIIDLVNKHPDTEFKV